MIASQPESLVQSSIFRAYDIRGIVDDTLTEDSVLAIGRAIGSLTLEKGDKSIVVARDGRTSGARLLKALCEGLTQTGCHVIDIGSVPTPVLYYSTHLLETRSGVMLTGSHNPANYNGLKIMVKGQTLAEDGIQGLYHRIVHQDFRIGQGHITQTTLLDQYIQEICDDIQLKRPLKIVVDCGNGIAGSMVPRLLRQMGCEVHELFCEVDGTFPNHHPDPSQAENLQDLINAVKTLKADAGLAFDGDGDRLGIVTNRGEIIWPDRQLMLFSQEVLSHTPGATIIYDVKCSHHLAKLIRDLGGNPIMWKTGHSLIKAKLAETHAALAGEMSGHIFFNDRWYGFDDAIYAAARLLHILSTDTRDLGTLFDTIPNSVNTPELKIFVHDDEKFLLMKELISQAEFATAETILTIDGLRVNFLNGWGLVRPSNTTPCLVLRFEAESEKVLTTIQNLFRDLLLTVKPELVLPF